MMVGIVSANQALAVLRSLEVGSDWFVMLLAIAVLSKHWQSILLLRTSQWARVSTCDFARSAALLLLSARAIMCAFAVAEIHERAFVIDIGRVVANFMTAIAVVPLFIALERPGETTLTEPENISKLFRLIIVLYIGTLAVSFTMFQWFR